jgi:antitoxin VapB
MGDLVYTNGRYRREAIMDTAKLFKSGRSQAVRLPKEFRFDGKEVFVKKVGEAVVLLPRENSWRTLYESLDLFSEDFMKERAQPIVEDAREPLFD